MCFSSLGPTWDGSDQNPFPRWLDPFWATKSHSVDKCPGDKWYTHTCHTCQSILNRVTKSDLRFITCNAFSQTSQEMARGSPLVGSSNTIPFHGLHDTPTLALTQRNHASLPISLLTRPNLLQLRNSLTCIGIYWHLKTYKCHN